VTLHLTEADVERLLSPADAVAAIEACFHRLAAGSIENKPRYRLRLEHDVVELTAPAVVRADAADERPRLEPLAAENGIG
jgi:hypothetical protein